MAIPYNHKATEQKWRKIWEEHPVNVNDGKKPKYYCLDMFPYPSGNGLHVGTDVQEGTCLREGVPHQLVPVL